MREDTVSVMSQMEDYGVGFDAKGFDNAGSHVSDVYREGSLGAGPQVCRIEQLRKKNSFH